MATYRIVRIPDADQDDVVEVVGPYPADTDEAAGRNGEALLRRRTIEPATDYRLQVQTESDGPWTDVGLMRTAWLDPSA